MHGSPLIVFLAVAGAQFLRYLVLAGGVFVLAHRSVPAFMEHRRIASVRASARQARREFMASTVSTLVFGLIGVLIVQLRTHGIAATPSEGSGLGALLWVPVLLVLQDTWFYFTHRLLHHPRLFKSVHAVHHRSLDPSPLASFSFHPIEALIEGLFAVLVALVAAPPLVAMLVFQQVAFFINLYGHLGVELLPAGLARSWYFKTFNTTSHHHQHHRTMNFNFGLYFQWWDRLLGTNHARYEETFMANASRGEADLSV